MRIALPLAIPSLLLVSASAFAGAQITPLGEPDKHGYLNHSVKCENGAKKIVQCVGGVQRCGYAGDQTLESIVASLCSGSPAAEPAGEGTPMQTQADGLSP